MLRMSNPTYGNASLCWMLKSMTDNDTRHLDPDRLRWQCRRGMLELDYLLQGFLDRRFAALSPDEQTLFVELLGCADPDLQAWLVAGLPPADPRYVQLIQQIRA